MKKALGFALIFFCTITRSGSNENNFLSPTLLQKKCLAVAESPHFSMVNKPKKGECENFIPHESHLSVISKANITRMYNQFREDSVKTKKVTYSATEMHWHWTLENEALEIISSCPSARLYKYDYLRNIRGLDKSLTCEYTVAVPQLIEASQKRFLSNLPQYLEKNIMHDFDEKHEFRRPNTLHFGCALTITNSTEFTSYFVCVYCSKEKSTKYKTSKCPEYTAKNENTSEFPHLCRAPKYLNFYGCEPKKAYSYPRPEIWQSITPDVLEQIYVFTSEQEIWFAINRTVLKMQDSKRVEENRLILKKPSHNSWLYNYTPLPEYCCIYDEETVNTLNISKLYSSPNKKRVKREGSSVTKLSQYPAIDPNYNYYPTCCIYLFVLNLILVIGLTILVSFTYHHHKSK